MWFATYITSNSWGKRGGAMIDFYLLEIICLLLFGVVTLTIVAVILIITFAVILSKKETHL
jgi:hypothetical protein